MALSQQELNSYFRQYLGRDANDNEFKIYSNAPIERLTSDLDRTRQYILTGEYPPSVDVPTMNSITDYVNRFVEQFAGDLVGDPFDFESARKIAEDEFKPYFDELIADYEEEQGISRRRLEEDFATAQQELAKQRGYIAEDEATYLQRFERKKQLLSEDEEKDLRRLGIDKGFSEKQFQLRFDELAAREAQAGRLEALETEQLAESLGQRGLFGSGIGTKEQGRLGEAQQERRDDIARSRAATELSQQISNEGFGRANEDIRSGYARQLEQLGYGREDFMRNSGRQLAGLDTEGSRIQREFERGIVDIDRLLERRKKDIGQQQEEAIGTDVVNQFLTGSSPGLINQVASGQPVGQ